VANKRQTISYLSKRFADVGLRPNRRHGQNFLIDLNLLQLLADNADLTSGDVILEIGTGTGSLTGRVAPHVQHVVTVEIDQHLHQLAKEELEEFENITFLHLDALKNKNQFDPRLVEVVQSRLKDSGSAPLKLVANLPFNIATPVIANLLRSSTVPQSMVVTIQKELADRIAAGPNSKDYGALSVWVQSLCDVHLVRILPPTVFWPRPKVHSAIVHIKYRPDKRSQIADLEFFHTFVRSVFFHRRKFLRSVLISAFRQQLTKAAVDSVLEQLQLGADTRAEQLTVEQVQELCEQFRRQFQP
jgi:16S rRNA (adenine1518-N6/adenine1519-N6)-dimethyltransferase